MSDKEIKYLAIICLICSSVIGIAPIISNGKWEFIFNPSNWWVSLILFLLFYLLSFLLGLFFITEMNDIERIDKENEEIEKRNKEFREKVNKWNL